MTASAVRTRTSGPATCPPHAHSPTAPTSRRAVVEALRAVLDDAGLPWAWQGDPEAVERWTRSTGPADLDVWCAGDPRVPGLIHRLDALLGARVVHSTDPRRLRHTSWAVELPSGLAVVDLTVGPLAVGALRLLDPDDIEVTPAPDGPALAGAAAICDLVLRRLLRGRQPSPAGLLRARAEYASATPGTRAAVLTAARAGAGRHAVEVLRVLEDAVPSRQLARQVRRRLVVHTTTRGLGAAAAHWRSVLPAGRAAGPLGLRTRGCVVVLVGTDGAGKSTVLEELATRLDHAGLAHRTAYFGMARGNLPGVGLVRRLLGVSPARAEDAAPGTPASEPVGARPDAHAGLRRVAAWYYAGEYVGRWLVGVAPHLARRRVVLVDRWVWDLRESPSPGSAAARFVERLVPAPDVVALPDAPAWLIHARKPERPEADQARQQEQFHAILAGRPARCAEVVVDTSGATEDPLRPLVAATIAAAHRRGRSE